MAIDYGLQRIFPYPVPSSRSTVRARNYRCFSVETNLPSTYLAGSMLILLEDIWLISTTTTATTTTNYTTTTATTMMNST